MFEKHASYELLPLRFNLIYGLQHLYALTCRRLSGYRPIQNVYGTIGIWAEFRFCAWGAILIPKKVRVERQRRENRGAE
jgi:hypothetical protein